MGHYFKGALIASSNLVLGRGIEFVAAAAAVVEAADTAVTASAAATVATRMCGLTLLHTLLLLQFTGK